MTCKSYDIPKTLIWEAWLESRDQGAAVDAGSDRAVRDEARSEPVQVESDEFRQAASAAGKGSANPEDPGAACVGHPDGIRQDRRGSAVKMWLEPRLDPIFHRNSYGYRPGMWKQAIASPTSL